MKKKTTGANVVWIAILALFAAPIAEDFSKEVTTLDKTGRRLVLFAPNEYPWADMGIDLSSTIRYDLSAIKSVDDIAEVMEFLFHAI